MKKKKKKIFGDYAKAYWSLGWNVIPIKVGSKDPAVKWKKWQFNRQTEEEIDKLVEDFELCNIALICGFISGVIVIDSETEEARVALAATHGDIPQTIMANTGKPTGKHIYFKHPGNKVLRNAVRILKDIDVRADCGYVLIPPSIHPNGRPYEWANGMDPLEMGLDDLLELPEDFEPLFPIHERLTHEHFGTPSLPDNAVHDSGQDQGIGVQNTGALADLYPELTDSDFDSNWLNGVEEGQRNDVCYKVVWHYLGKGKTKHQAEQLTHDWNDKCNPPMEKDEVDKVLQSAFSRLGEQGDPMTQVVDSINKTNAFGWTGDKFVVLSERWDYHYKKNVVRFRHRADVAAAWANRYVWVLDGKGKLKPKNHFEVWFRHQNRRQYDQVVFAPYAYGDPNPTPSSVYNLFRGWPLEPKKGSWTPFKDHIHDIVCDNNDDVYDWVLTRMAYHVQNPAGPLPGTSIVMRGDQGCGKGCFAQNYGLIFGKDHFRQIDNPEHAFGNFNKLMQDALVVYLDETEWGGNREHRGTLKRLITEPDIVITLKGKDSIVLPNLSLIIISGNDNWLVPVTSFERRFMIMRASNKKVDNIKYFNKVFDCMENGGAAAMFYDLLSKNLNNGINLRRPIMTREMEMQQRYSHQRDLYGYWREQLEQGYIISETNSLGTGWPDFITTDEWHDSRRYHCKINQIRYPEEKNVFIRQMKEFCNVTYRRKGKARTPGYILPPLSDCIKQFEKASRLKVQSYYDGLEEVSEDDSK